jgi:hypothetical protein
VWLAHLAVFIVTGVGCAACLAEPAVAGSAVDLADAMMNRLYSDGFEARMTISVTTSGAHAGPIKVAVIGQLGPERQRLLVKGISPDSVRDRFVAVERRPDGSIRAIQYDGASENVSEVDPFANLFETGVVVWDLLSPWWQWPLQHIVGTDHRDGRDCTVVRSRHADAVSPIAEVVSCVEPGTRLALRTQLFDARGNLVRTKELGQMLHTASGSIFAKTLSIKERNGSVTEIDVYGGDEQYSIRADTFSRLDRTSEARR